MPRTISHWVGGAPFGGASDRGANVTNPVTGVLLPFVNFNRIHGAPPLNVSMSEAAAGVAMIGCALERVSANV